ncbi:MAG TPA: PKD domain-containing protein [Candidatus Sulfomarinibacteraceae bacterium]|nr:PKD domain-containing protein [Candidatus Sulfomarinibacteraceae bacterium]
MNRTPHYKTISLLVVLSLLLQVIALPASAVQAVPRQAAGAATTTALQPQTALASSTPAPGTAPPALSAPLSVSRVQTTYQPDSSVTITYTVTNNRPPTRFLDIPLTATVTETVQLSMEFNAADDPNTLQNVLLTTSLADAATFSAASPAPNHDGATLAWNLGHIPPLTSKTATLTLNASAASGDFSDLDSGARAHGLLQGRGVSAATAPAMVVAPNLSQWLVWTVDADIYDEAMLARAGELGQDPEALFAFVRSLDYESYTGSLRGTRGTLWSSAGNSADQASLLIAMLRAAGIPARYRHGALSTAGAQTLIDSMFPEPARYVGQMPDAAVASDPLNDPQLLAETSDHWWVEAYLPGQGWQDMDPAFANAAIGDSFATPAGDGSDRIAELPDDVRHKVALQLKVEDYHPLNVGNGHLNYTYPFAHTLNVVEVAARPVSFSHLVQTESQGGLAYSNVIHTYTPYLLVGDTDIFGDPYQEFFTNFPLGTRMLTGAWLEIDLIAPDGETHSYERELKDRIGYENRITGGTVDFAFAAEDAALFTEFDILSLGFWPHFVPSSAREQTQAAALDNIPQINADGQRLMELRDQETYSPMEEEELRAIRLRYQLNMSRFLSNITLSFAETADRVAQDLNHSSFVRSYYDTPRLVIAGSQVTDEESGEFSLDLRRTTLRTIAYPGQDAKATVGFNIARGVIESGIEGAVMETIFGAPATTTARLFEAAREQDIFPVAIEAANLYTLDGLDISEEGKARITAAALDGKFIYVPHAQVLLDGEYQTGWWEIDPITGETIGVMDNGLHLAALGYVANLAITVMSGPLVDFMLGFTAYTWGFVANHVDKAIGPGTFDQDSYNWWIGAYGTTLTCVATVFLRDAYGMYSCASGAVGAATDLPLDFFGAGQKAAETMLTSLVAGDPPIPSAWMAHLPDDAPPFKVQEQVTASAVYDPGPLSATLDSAFVAHSGDVKANWSTPGDNAVHFNSLTLSQGQLYDAGGAPLGSGSLQAAPAGEGPATAIATAAGDVTVSVEGSGDAASYAAAPGGLGGGAAWHNVTARIQAGDDYTLALRDAAVTIDGETYTGDFTIETEQQAVFTGAGPALAVSYAGALNHNYDDAALIIGPATGTATGGGAALDVSNGLAITGYSESLTVTDAGSEADHVALEDTVDFFTLNLSPAGSATLPQSPFSFQTHLEANFSGAYTVTVSGPPGWALSLDQNGQVSAQAAAGAPAGDYAILVTAQSVDYPALALSAVHNVTVAEHDGLQLDLQPDPIFTVPMGPSLNPHNPVPADTNTGQTQVPGAAYTINVTNTANSPRTIDLAVSGLPQGWTLLSNAPGATQTSLALGPGEVGQIGLYVAPDHLPAPGVSHQITVDAASDSGQNAQDSATFTMPEVPFSMVLAEPPLLYTGPNSSTTFDLSLTNVGNAAGSFPLSWRAPSDLVAPDDDLESPINLAPGEDHVQQVTLNVGDAPLGQTFPVYFDSPVAGTVYTQTVAAFVKIVNEDTGVVFEALDQVCIQEAPALAAALETLAQNMAELQTACATGNCHLALRDQVVASLQSVAGHGAAVSPLVTTAGALEDIAGDLATQEDEAGIADALAAIGPAVSDLTAEVCEITQHNLALRWAPGYDAALPGQPVTYSLVIENRGIESTTYDVNVDLPDGPIAFQETIAPGDSYVYEAAVSENDSGLYTLTAAAEAVGPDVTLDGIEAQATARLNVVDRFLQLTSVSADPPFVESGTSLTTVRATVANVANVVQPAIARTTITGPDGGTHYNADLPVTILGGSARTYDLDIVETSNWDAGVYTITVDLLDETLQPIFDGYGYGQFGVGQSVTAGHAVFPTEVAPGTVTVTTVITTESDLEAQEPEPEGQSLGQEDMSSIYDAPFWDVAQSGELSAQEKEEINVPLTFDSETGPDDPADADHVEADAENVEPLDDDTADEDEETLQPAPHASLSDPQTMALTINGAFTRYEQDDPALTLNGSWSSVNLSSASDGGYARSGAAGDTAVLDFNGTWLNIGFVGSRSGGHVEIVVDGDSHGIVDLYRIEDNIPFSVVIDGLDDAPHTVTMTVQAGNNPYSLRQRLELDYVDVWDGQPLGDGYFEQDDPRVLLSPSWNTQSDANASGGDYVRSSSATAWFPFDGDSFSYHAIAYSNGNKARLYVDGQYLDTVDLYNPDPVVRTYSYEGFGPGPHLLQVSSYRGVATLDALETPGQAPFTDPNPPVTGVTRYEEDHHAIRYNGVPYIETSRTWSRTGGTNGTRASDGQYINSATGGDTISFDFEGTWIGVGFVTNRFSGIAEIAIDGDVVAEADLYTRFANTESFYFKDLDPGSHTITITVTGEGNPIALNSQIYLDYFDVWDGDPLAEGIFEETDERIFTSNGWSQSTNDDASGGSFANSGNSNSTAWFPFTGDSVTAQVWTHKNYDRIELKIDGVSQGLFHTNRVGGGPRSFSFDGLGAGAHVLEVRRYRGNVTFDAFITPSTLEHYDPPAPVGVIRLEEDHPDLRYDGYPFRQMPPNWNTGTTLNETSGRYYATTGTAGNTLSLDFEGPWVGVGFHSTGSTGVAEIFIDGVSRGQFDTSGGPGGVTSIYYDDLGPGAHTIEVVVVSGTVRPDYIDIWDGQTIDDGWYDADLDDSARFHFSYKDWWTEVENQYAHGGTYLTGGIYNFHPNLWFTFVGNDLTVLGFNRANSSLHISIDGQSYGEFDMTAEYSNQPYALHFPDLGEGPHVVQVLTYTGGRVDAFEVNPDGFYSYTPQIKWHDDSAKEELDPDYGTGFLSSIALGDLQGDGIVELVAPARNGRLYVYRGDGADAGDGTPIIWYSDLPGPAAEPALVDLTGDGAAEIIVAGYNGAFAFRHDGTLLWEQEAAYSHWGDSGGIYGWGGPTVGNLDDDLYPEIVIAGSGNGLYVLDHEGTILDSVPINSTRPTVPVLADITGDGSLDIIVAIDRTLTVYEFDALDGLSEAWSYTLDQTHSGLAAFGAPAVADITGDGAPEIIVNWGHYIDALKADGDRLWSYYTGNTSHWRPSPVTVADVTGDGEMNLITASAVGSNHNLMVLRTDGSLVWEQLVGDNTASASGVAAQDLDGDGVWEILWNGAQDGFLIIRGDGKRLFNEPVTASGTIIDYPALGDVDGDGVADVVTAGRNGIFVISHEGHWIDSRPMWNQHNYHVTNINDDWSVPFQEPNSWDLHNTYRTQTPDRDPAPAYRIEVTHTVGLDGVTVLTDTFSSPPGGAPPDYYWEYQLQSHAPDNSISFDSELAGMQPGESRQVNQGTDIAYRLPSGWNSLNLPPLYVTAPHIVAIDPDVQTVGAGGTAVYTVTLTNPAGSADTYTLDISGLPEGWSGLPETVAMDPNSTVTLEMTVTTSVTAEPDTYPFALFVENESGGRDQAGAILTVVHALDIAITPAEQTTPIGEPVTYTLSLTNHEDEERTFDLAASGQPQVTIPPQVTVPANDSVALPIQVSAANNGVHPFTVHAAGAHAAASATALLRAIGDASVGLTLSPDPAVTGPGSTALLAMTVTNLGGIADAYDLALDLPDGWTYTLQANGATAGSIALPPYVFNSAALDLATTPPADAAPGVYAISATATSQAQPAISATANATVEVLEYGVQVQVEPASATMQPVDSGVWQVTVTNTGVVADSFDLNASGIVGPSSAFSANPVALDPGQSTTVQLTAGPFDFALPTTYPFSVAATSQGDDRVHAEAIVSVTFEAYEALEVAWRPPSQTVTDTFTADFLLVITNTGNVSATHHLDLDMPALSGQLPVDAIPIPAKTTAQIPVTVHASSVGTHTILATATAGAGSDSATATLTVLSTSEPPTANAGPDQTVNEGQLVAFAGSGEDPEGATLEISWDFGDGATASGSFNPTHTYADDGDYLVTLTVTDDVGLSASDSLIVTVLNVAPTVDAGPDQTVDGGVPVHFEGSFTDPGVLDTHSIEWDFGDGSGAAGTLTPVHVYDDAGVYTVTLTVTDDDGGVGSDTLVVTVETSGFRLLLPMIRRD